MVDLISHKVIDLIPSRKTEDVQSWLATFPNLSIISRDGAATYRNAISKSHQQAIQISDRFHLIKGLTECCQGILKNILPPKIYLSKVNNSLIEPDKRELTGVYSDRVLEARRLHQNGVSRTEICKQLNMDIRTLLSYCTFSEEELNQKLNTRSQKIKNESTNRKAKIVNKVRELKKTGLSIRKIGLQLSLDSRTVKKYIDPNFSPERVRRSGPDYALSFSKEIERMLNQGQSGVKIFHIIQENGFKGTYSCVMNHIKKLKIKIKQNNKDYIVLKRTDILKLLFHPLPEVKTLTLEHLKILFSHYPVCDEIIKLVSQFKKLLNEDNPDALDSWINKAILLNINKINNFISSIKRDYFAVKNSILYDYNNGLAEGSVNKLKVIKRIMYGRNHFETLRTKLLWKEQY